MLWRAARRPSRGRRSTGRRAARSAVRRRSRRWPSAITIIGRCGPAPPRQPGRERNERRPQDHRRDRSDRDRVEAAQVRVQPRHRHRRRGAHRLWRREAARGAEAAQMSILAIIVAIVFAYLAFRFVKGIVKFALLAVIVIIALWFVSGGLHGMGLR